METAHVRFIAEPALHQPVLLFAFTGWNDAGNAASMAVRGMIERWHGSKFAEIDPEPFTDFASERPFVVLHDGQRQIRWPTVDLWSASLPGADAIVVVGPEPALRWREFCGVVVALAERFGVSMSISLGALLAEIPHTRPPQLIATSSDDNLLERFDLQPPTYEGPTGIVGVLSASLADAGIPAASLWATVPAYTVPIAAVPSGAALARAACSMVGAPLPPNAFSEAMMMYERRIAALLESDDDVAAFVERLEQLLPEDGAGDVSGQAMTPSDLDDANARLVAEVEQFLRDSHDDDDHDP